MKKINMNFPDTEECISKFRSLAENLREDADFVRKLILSGEVPESGFSEIKMVLENEAVRAEKSAEFLTLAAGECGKTEEQISCLVRKYIFEHRGSIIVEKSKIPVQSSLISGKSVKHDSTLVSLILKERAGEMS